MTDTQNPAKEAATFEGKQEDQTPPEQGQEMEQGPEGTFTGHKVDKDKEKLDWSKFGGPIDLGNDDNMADFLINQVMSFKLLGQINDRIIGWSNMLSQIAERWKGPEIERDGLQSLSDLPKARGSIERDDGKEQTPQERAGLEKSPAEKQKAEKEKGEKQKADKQKADKQKADKQKGGKKKADKQKGGKKKARKAKKNKARAAAKQKPKQKPVKQSIQEAGKGAQARKKAKANKARAGQQVGRKRTTQKQNLANLKSLQKSIKRTNNQSRNRAQTRSAARTSRGSGRM